MVLKDDASEPEEINDIKIEDENQDSIEEENDKEGEEDESI